jgi:hypothetical protein
MRLAVPPQRAGAADDADNGRDLSEAEHAHRTTSGRLREAERQKLFDQVHHCESSVTLEYCNAKASGNSLM